MATGGVLSGDTSSYPQQEDRHRDYASSYYQTRDYALTGKPDKRLLPQKPVISSPVEIIKIREACQLARKVLDEVKEIVEPGITTDELDRFAREYRVIHNRKDAVWG